VVDAVVFCLIIAYGSGLDGVLWVFWVLRACFWVVFVCVGVDKFYIILVEYCVKWVGFIPTQESGWLR
jgi:hypothetical protein